MTNKTVVLVAGMHRSGTSALTRVVNLLGATVARDLMEKSEDNPHGYWEPAEVVHIHEQMLSDLGSTWDDLDPLPVGWANGEPGGKAASAIKVFLERSLEAHDVLVVKDPRLSHLLPLWLPLLEQLSVKPLVLVPIRHPMEVALSLNLRDGFPLWKSWLLWMQACLESEFESRTVPRLYVEYASLFADWRTFAERLHGMEPRLGTITVATARAIDAFIDPGLRRNRCNENAVSGLYRPFDQLKTLYDQLTTAATGRDDEFFRAALDDIGRRLEGSGARLGAARSADTLHSNRHMASDENAPALWAPRQARPGRTVGPQPTPREAIEERLFRNVVLTDPIRLVNPDAWVSHIPFAFWLVDSLRPGVIVELGTHTGNSYAALAQAVQVTGITAQCFAVDTWKGDVHAGSYGDEVYAEWSRFHADNFPGFSHLLRCTFDEAVSNFEDHSVDLLHIDGLHTFDAVRHDFETWRPKLSKRAVVLFHDVAVKQPGFEASEFWDEVRQSFPSFTFPHGNGLGVLVVGSESGPDLQWLTQLRAPDELMLVNRFFCALGDAHRSRLWIDSARKELSTLTGLPGDLEAYRGKETNTNAEGTGADGRLARSKAAFMSARDILASQRTEYAKIVEALRSHITTLDGEHAEAREDADQLA